MIGKRRVVCGDSGVEETDDDAFALLGGVQEAASSGLDQAEELRGVCGVQLVHRVGNGVDVPIHLRHIIKLVFGEPGGEAGEYVRVRVKKPRAANGDDEPFQADIIEITSGGRSIGVDEGEKKSLYEEEEKETGMLLRGHHR
ncbi:hypothetical protein IEQ34_001726 [Dendrobium chrysotoxum]|uniref:Uncharacterized protein n=1 Tax=Dendrobium chrysotoxum TaxID=161865 RepID=A0AAV7HRG1_DENCH|nr:hypothetical protein IEQ34_001726 [Dendrobium chrysotoxum]